MFREISSFIENLIKICSGIHYVVRHTVFVFLRHFPPGSYVEQRHLDVAAADPSPAKISAPQPFEFRVGDLYLATIVNNMPKCVPTSNLIPAAINF